MQKPYYIFITSRPVNVLLTALSVGIGYWFSEAALSDMRLLYALASAGLICAGGNIFNDFYDAEIDRINKPHRPYAAGKLSAFEMAAGGFIVFTAGLLLSYPLGLVCIQIAALTVALLLFYDKRAKRTVLFGNAIVSILTGLAFLYGGAAGGNLPAAAIPAVFAAVYHFGREILKDIEDAAADKAAGAVTFPVRHGRQIGAAAVGGGLRPAGSFNTRAVSLFWLQHVLSFNGCFVRRPVSRVAVCLVIRFNSRETVPESERPAEGRDVCGVGGAAVTLKRHENLLYFLR